jgi:hypothetical protein
MCLMTDPTPISAVPTGLDADHGVPTHPHMEEIAVRLYGSNVTMTRSAWLEMLDDVRRDSETYRRLVRRLSRVSA